MGHSFQGTIKLESSALVNICRMSDLSWDKDSGSWLFFCFFLSIFLFSLFCMFTLKICVRIFSGSIETRMLKLYVHMDDELWYGVIENQAHYSYSFLYLYIFLSFLDKFLSHFLRN